MKSVNYISKLLILLFGVSCTNDSQSTLDYTPLNFPISKNVEVSKLCDDYIFSVTRDMSIVGSSIFLRANCDRNNHSLQIIDINNKKHIASFGTQGRGEGELSEFSTFDINPHSEEFIAISQNKYVIYDLKKILSNDTNYIKAQGVFKNVNSTSEIFYLSDDKLLHAEAQPRFIITTKDLRDTLGRYDERHYISNFFAEHKNPDLQRQYFRENSLFTVKPDKSKFVNSAYNGFYMEIFDIKKDKITSVQECRFVEPRMKNEIMPMDGCIAGPLQIRSTDKYIYVLYSTDFGFDVKNVQLGVFDWKGREVKNYVLDKFTYNFAVTPDDNSCYCWVQNADGEEYLGYFDLK